ncbi:MAG: glycosyltransferase involved in cell wall biosynthesis [Pseudohongiellaceae bacterium]|jgi:glycosyltransferase involved in cell wall biosynthesis
MNRSVRESTARPTLSVITSTWPRNPQDITGRFLADLVFALPLPCEIVCPDDPEHGLPALPTARLQRFANHGVFYGAGAMGNFASKNVSSVNIARTMTSMLRTALASSRKCDVIFSHWAVPGGLIGALCRRITSRPHVLLLHSADVYWLEQHRSGPAIASFIADHCDALCGVSESIIERFEALSGRRGRVLGCGVTMPPLSGTQARRAARVGCLSRFVPGKGLRRLVNVATSVPGELRIAGAGPLRNELTALAHTSGAFHLDGAQVGLDKQRWLQQLDVFAAPFTGMPWGQPEGLPVSILEAQAAGLPVVAFEGALPEHLVRDGHNGRLVPQGDWQGFAGVLAELLRDHEQRRRLGETARRQVAPYEMGKVAAEWAALFEDVASRGRGAPRGC